MPLSSRRHRQGPCLCGSSRSLAACCLPWEEAFQRLISRLVAFAKTPRIRRHEARSGAIFWTTERPLQPGTGRTATENLRFLEWFLQDQPTHRGGPLLGVFAEAAAGLSLREEELLFALLLAPVRAYQVTETLGPGGFLLEDLLTGEDRVLGPFGLSEPLIRSDIMICRLVPLGRLTRPGAGFLRFPGTSREELMAYLRTTYRVTRRGRHLTLEDFLDGSTHLYHHFFHLRGRDLGARAQETLRRAAFEPGRIIYRGTDTSRIRAGLDRQSEIIREAASGEEIRYAWIDLDRAVTRATVLVGSGEVQVCADTQEDLGEARQFLETCLRGLIALDRQIDDASAPATVEGAPRSQKGPPGGRFLARILAQWPDSPSALLDDRTPREACRSRAGRQQVAALLIGLERDFARLKRLGRAWADVGPVREALSLPPA